MRLSLSNGRRLKCFTITCAGETTRSSGTKLSVGTQLFAIQLGHKIFLLFPRTLAHNVVGGQEKPSLPLQVDVSRLRVSLGKGKVKTGP